jgi:fido (protein-threonine AMPylation protein)
MLIFGLLDSDSHVDMAVRFHHGLVQIHPFPNGNGRHTRLMADLLLENVFGETRLGWGTGTDLSDERYSASIIKSSSGYR